MFIGDPCDMPGMVGASTIQLGVNFRGSLVDVIGIIQ